MSGTKFMDMSPEGRLIFFYILDNLFPLLLHSMGHYTKMIYLFIQGMNKWNYL